MQIRNSISVDMINVPTVFVLLTISLLMCNVQGGPRDLPTIRRTANGYVEGVERTSSMGQKYYSFRSVPYAEPPITGKDPYTGEMVNRRFKAPEPLKRVWSNEVLMVKDYGFSCLESTNLIPTLQPTGEDCLFLNIYVPAGGAKKKTVLVWIHGGGFTEGGHREGLYGPDFLLAEDNIVVAIQYRLGLFGFLNLGYGNYSGNMGLKDQQMALKYIYENIEEFSGNKSEILLFGESAGGASTTFHMLNEESRKYFTRALVMSGSVFSYFALTPENHRQKMGECAHTDKLHQMTEYVVKSDYRDLIQCYYQYDLGITLKPDWVPTIEVSNAVKPFITLPPEEIWKSRNAPVIDTFFTFVTQEQVTFDLDLVTRSDPLITEDGESSIELPFDNFDEDHYPDEYKKVMKKLRAAYYSGSTDANVIRDENIALMSDLNFGDSVLKALKLQVEANGDKKKTYLLRYGVNDKLNLIKLLHDSKHKGAAHAEELCYIFHCHLLDVTNVYNEVLRDRNSVSYKTIKRMVKTITNWARYGDPSIQGDTTYKPIVSTKEIFCQEMTNEPISTITTDIFKQLRYDTWRQIEKIYKNRMEVDEDY